ncbi:MAG TPA: tRNA lysidine(34) synthetase TilS [Candidatus Bathyarchaeia archaeon]|nr:tRNA lysidine(34) synthetase TilS [Candidatus Bathyarchaeia archaeon]
MNLIKKIQENIFRYELFERGGKIVVGCSGGPDSVCLLDALHELQKKYNLELIVAHVNYKLRKKDSDKDEALVKKLVEKYELPIEILHNPEYTIQDTNLEEKLRTYRYAFFEKISKKYKANAIAVAHNLNDQAETVLLRLLRGTGLRGLGAMSFATQRGPSARPKRNADGPRIIRPLLNIPRKEILAYLLKKKIPFRVDKTNLTSDFTRNKVRNKLLPYLEKNFNPRVQDLLFKFSKSAAADYDFISRYSAAWLAENQSLRVSELNSLHPAIRREVLRQALAPKGALRGKTVPDLREIESGHIEEIIKILKSSKNKKQKISFKGLKMERIGDRLVIEKSENQSSNVK